MAALAIVHSMSQLDETMPPDRDLVPTDPLQRAVWYGIDLTLLKENLRRTPTERLENHRRALEAVKEIRKAAHERRIRTTPANHPHRRGQGDYPRRLVPVMVTSSCGSG
jgi:hypothetical protein